MYNAIKPPIITDDERLNRIKKLRQKMEEQAIHAVLLGSTDNLRYFTGLNWHASERFLGCIITNDSLTYIVPAFEESRVNALPHIEGEIIPWDEDVNPADIIKKTIKVGRIIAFDDAVTFSHYINIAKAIGSENIQNAASLTRPIRLVKSKTEIEIIKYIMGLTLHIHKLAFNYLKPNIKASEVVKFIDEQHRLLNNQTGSTFTIVSFGLASSLPHGAETDQILLENDIVLIDTGTRFDGYHSDLTRSYGFGNIPQRYSDHWHIEREMQQAVFDAAKIGATYASLDDCARKTMVKHGLGPDFKLPGLPHRAGHGIGLEIHEEPYIVRGNNAHIEAGVCFSNEPMIVFPNHYGIRLEDHIYMTDEGANWFTLPLNSPDGADLKL